jgi:hypothetical protein
MSELDSVVRAVISKFEARATFGKQKYGTDLDRQDLKTIDWITHAQEELMDGILYLEKLKQEFTTHQGRGSSQGASDPEFSHTDHTLTTSLPVEPKAPQEQQVGQQKPQWEPPQRLDSVEDLKQLGGC